MEALLPISPHVLPLPFFLLAAVRLSFHLLPIDVHYVVKAEAREVRNKVVMNGSNSLSLEFLPSRLRNHLIRLEESHASSFNSFW